MRRTLVAALAALFLWAPFAEGAGRVAVISVPHSTENSLTTAVQRADIQTSRQRALLYTRAFLDAHAVPGNYDVIPARFVQTSRIRFGLVNGWNGDTAYAAVIWNGLGNGITAATQTTAGCFPCSLTITGMLPTVPQLFIGTGNSETEFTLSNSCSLMTGDSQDPGTQGPSYSGQRVHIAGSRDVFGWIPGTQGSTPNDERDSTIVEAWPAGGTRVVMGGSLSNNEDDGGSFGDIRAANKRPAWRDSIFSTTWENRFAVSGGSVAQFDSRTVYIADRMNLHKRDTTFAKIVYAHWLATAVPTTGGDDAVDARPTGNPFVIWAAIAHLDSISGFAVLGRSPTPRAIAVQVSGGLSRGAWNAAGGLRPSDPNFAKAVDSLAALNIPFAVGVPANAADTIATYASDLTTWARASRARFALSATLGTKDTTVVGAGAASPTKAFDLFGRFRSRIFYANSAADTSVYEMLVAARVRLDSLLAANSLAGRRDNMLIAGQDDYSPRNWAFPSNCRDSLASVARLAGFTGIAVNPEDDSLDVATPTNPKGLREDTQGWSRATIGASAGERFLYAAFPGYNPRGAVYGNGGGNASVLDDSNWVAVYAHRALWGLYLPAWAMDAKDGWVVNAAPQTGTMTTPWFGEPTTSYTSKRSTRATGTNLVRITASSLGYGGNGPSADMPGFYQVKYTVNMCKAINALAGRTLIRFVYPGDLTVDDLKR